MTDCNRENAVTIIIEIPGKPDGKRCSRCGHVKPFNHFHRAGSSRDGHHAYCIPCRKEYRATPAQRAVSSALRKRHAQKRREEWRAYREVNAEKEKKRSREWRRGNLDWFREYDQSEKARISKQAKRAVHKAIVDGTLKRQPCERCGSEVNIHAHHEDYSRPLDVIWLCRTCHGLRHREINDAKNPHSR